MAKKQPRRALSTSEVNDLPDSSFALILPGGRKDSDGKTVPRTLRKLPYRDASGKLLFPQAVNALAVLNGARGGVAAPKAAKVAAWNKIVAAIKRERPDYTAPPRRF